MKPIYSTEDSLLFNTPPPFPQVHWCICLILAPCRRQAFTIVHQHQL